MTKNDSYLILEEKNEMKPKKHTQTYKYIYSKLEKIKEK